MPMGNQRKLLPVYFDPQNGCLLRTFNSLLERFLPSDLIASTFSLLTSSVGKRIFPPAGKRFGQKLLKVSAVGPRFIPATGGRSLSADFPVCRAFSGPSWRQEGVGVMPAPYSFLHRH